MNILDLTIIEFLNQFAQESKRFDMIWEFWSINHLLKAGLFTAAFWFLWFDTKKNASDREQLSLNFLWSGAFSLFVARAIAIFSPFSPRPVFNKELQFKIPYALNPNLLDGWSSFPSDHAALFTALSIGIFFYSRKYGIIAFLYACIFIFFDRIYLGFHYPTDILVGILIGVLIAMTIFKTQIFKKINDKILSLRNLYPGLFYAFLFISLFQVTTMFGEVRQILFFMKELWVGHLL